MPLPTSSGEDRLEESRVRRSIVVVDVVDSVRLMQQHEADVIDRWRRFVNDVRAEVLPRHGGRMVKSLGDGMLVEFSEAPPAVAAALDMHRRIAAFNVGRSPDQALLLRIGAHAADVVLDELDVYGTGVNLAARLTRLAEAGETVISSALRDQLVPGLDVQTEDLGECEIKGLPGTVRAHRIAGNVPAVTRAGLDTMQDARASIVVLPLRMLGDGGPDTATIGELVVDDITQGLSGTQRWRVISRLTAQAFRGRQPTPEDLRVHLGATYVVSGSAALRGDHVTLRLELADTGSSEIVWADSVAIDPALLMLPQHVATDPVIQAIAGAIYSHEMRRSRSHPLPSLRSYTMLFGAVALMHRLSRQDFDRAWSLLEQLADRHPHAPEPRAWMAKWHIMKVAQGWSHEPQAQAGKAHEMTQRALDRQGDHSLALAIDGLAAAFLQGDLDLAERRYQAALASNPNEALAWLFMSALHVYRDRGEQAAEAAAMALRLSPLDPMGYFYDSFAATAMLAAGRYDEAITLGRRSVRANCTHLPTFRTLAIAQVLSGDEAGAHETIARLLRVDPAYSIAAFRERYAGRHAAHADRYAQALAVAGLPSA